MISVKEAKQIINDNCLPLQPVSANLNDASGLVLAEDVYSLTDVPNFLQSSMDGYAFNFECWKENPGLEVKVESAAGNPELLEIPDGGAARIFTGAPLPINADTVVMQEKTLVTGNRLLITDEQIIKGTNCREKGAEIKKNECILPSGSRMNPGAIGLLASAGITSVNIFPNPSVTIILTGNEIIEPGVPLKFGQVYNSNSFALIAALKQMRIDQVRVVHARDDLDVLAGILSSSLHVSDAVLLTGGVSVGDYDFVLKAAEMLKIGQCFHKIKQRPGKPLYFGIKEKKLVFGLPGNPSSVLSCFYQYVFPALNKLRNSKEDLPEITTSLTRPFLKPKGLTHFLKGFFNGKHAIILEAQESYRMVSFAVANCLIEIEEEATEVLPGKPVNIHLLPNYT